jgi:hypothetical protein
MPARQQYLYNYCSHITSPLQRHVSLCRLQNVACNDNYQTCPRVAFAPLPGAASVSFFASHLLSTQSVPSCTVFAGPVRANAEPTTPEFGEFQTRRGMHAKFHPHLLKHTHTHTHTRHLNRLISVSLVGVLRNNWVSVVRCSPRSLLPTFCRPEHGCKYNPCIARRYLQLDDPIGQLQVQKHGKNFSKLKKNCET